MRSYRVGFVAVYLTLNLPLLKHRFAGGFLRTFSKLLALNGLSGLPFRSCQGSALPEVQTSDFRQRLLASQIENAPMPLARWIPSPDTGLQHPARRAYPEQRIEPDTR